MSEANRQTVQEQMQEAAPEKKSGCGKCCLVSCLGVIVLTVVSVVAAVILVPRYVRSLREQFSLITQESVIFPDTIRENIAYGRPIASVNEVKDAVVGSAESVLFQHRIRLGGEVAIGEEEEFGISDKLFGMTWLRIVQT